MIMRIMRAKVMVSYWNSIGTNGDGQSHKHGHDQGDHKADQIVDDHNHDDCDFDQTDDDDDVGGRGQGQLQVLVSRRDNKQEVKTRNLFAIISGVYMHLLMLCTRCLCFLSCVQASPIML